MLPGREPGASLRTGRHRRQSRPGTASGLDDIVPVHVSDPGLEEAAARHLHRVLLTPAGLLRLQGEWAHRGSGEFGGTD